MFYKFNTFNIKKKWVIELKNNRVKALLIFIMATGILALLALWSYNNVLNKDSSKDYGSSIISYINEVESKNAYIQFDTGSDSYMYLLYNKDGEAVIELSDGGIGVYKSDNKLITLTEDKVIEISDLNPLAFIKAMVNVATTNDGCSVTLSQEEDDEIYTISVDGKENIQKIYDTLGDSEYTTRSMEMLETGFEDAAGVSMIAEVVKNDSGAFGATLSTIYKSADTEIKEDERYYSWKFDGYLETMDWGLSEAWYTEDMSNTEAWHTLMSDTISEVADNMSTYISSLQDEVDNGGSTSEEN